MRFDIPSSFGIVPGGRRHNDIVSTILPAQKGQECRGSYAAVLVKPWPEYVEDVAPPILLLLFLIVAAFRFGKSSDSGGGG